MSTQKIEFQIENIHCQSCVSKIESFIRSLSTEIKTTVLISERKVILEMKENSKLELIKIKQLFEQNHFKVSSFQKIKG